MNEYDLFEAIGNIDKKYVEEAAVSEPSSPRRAACTMFVSCS